MSPYYDGERVHADSDEEANAYIEGMKKGRELAEEEIKKPKEKLDPIEQRLFALDEALEKLFIGKEWVDFKNRLIFAKEYANSLKIKITSEELKLRIWDTRKRVEGDTEDYSPDDIIEAPPHLWSWEKLIMMSDTNLISASPKVGKTTLLIEMISKWARGEEEFFRS